MKGALKNSSNADFYIGLLSNLNADGKLDLIAKLTQLLKKKEKPSPTLESLFGAYKSDESAEDIISNLRKSRNFNRNIEPL